MRDKVKDKKTENRENNTFRPIYSIAFILILILISIAYATLALNYGIKFSESDIKEEPDTPDKPVIITRRTTKVPVTVIKKYHWNIRFENISVFNGSVDAVKDPVIDSTGTGVNYEVYMDEPGEYYKFSVDIVNRGTMDAKIYDIINNGFNDAQKRYLSYEIEYADGSPISIDDLLYNGERKTIIISLKFKEDITADDLPEKQDNIKLNYQIYYVEK